jgi:hypothetical protein
MGLDTFVATHSSHTIALGFTNKCVALEFRRHNTPLIFTLNLSMIKFGPNFATLAFVINPSCAQHHKLHGTWFDNNSHAKFVFHRFIWNKHECLSSICIVKTSLSCAFLKHECHMFVHIV